MGAVSDFSETFATLRGILERHGKRLTVLADKPGDFRVALPDRVDRIGRPLFAAGVQIRKNYVSFHLMPVYADPALLKSISPGLRKRMQGKSCFNFTRIDAAQAGELAALTKAGLARLRTIELPWD